MRFSRKIFQCVTLLLVVLLSSCAENLPQDIPKTYQAPVEHTFVVPYDKAWKGTVRAVSEENLVKTLEKESGLIVTEFGTINKRVLNMMQTAMFGRTYKNSYSLNLTEVAPGKTNIRVQSNLMMEQFALYNRERNVDWFEAYMRQDLFKRICINLYQDAAKCLTLFPDYNMNSVSCPTPPPVVSEEIAAVPATPPPAVAKGPDMSIKEVQKALVNAGYEPGPVDGFMGQKTRAAISRFQKDNGLEGGGYINPATMAALGL